MTAVVAALRGSKPSATPGGKLALPATPAPDDRGGQCAWLTAAFALDPAHPVTGGAREGLRGAAGHVVINRAGAPPLRFEPATHLNQPQRLIEDLSWQMLPSDGAVPAFKGEHCRAVAHVVRMLTDAAQEVTDAQETAGIIGTFLSAAEPVEGLTVYGTTAQRYEAASGLQRDLDAMSGRPIGAPRYLIDADTGELVIRASDLAEAARRHVGSTLPRGWLDARIVNLGWTRAALDGHAVSGREGRQGPHARCNVYRGHPPAGDADDSESVTT
jgi:hypothetical protein